MGRGYLQQLENITIWILSFSHEFPSETPDGLPGTQKYPPGTPKSLPVAANFQADQPVDQVSIQPNETNCLDKGKDHKVIIMTFPKYTINF